MEEAEMGEGHVEEGYFMGDSETLTSPYILPLSVKQAGCPCGQALALMEAGSLL